MQNTNFLIDALNQYLPFPRKKANHGININCPMCMLRGESRPDTKFRCGIRMFGGGGIHINCFNCGMATRWIPGSMLNRNTSLFLGQLGLGDGEVQKLKFKAWQMCQNVQLPTQSVVLDFAPDFKSISLPSGALSLSTWAQYDLEDLDFLQTVEYAASRGTHVFDVDQMYWTPESGKHQLNRRLLIPFYWQGNIVGYTGRAIDSTISQKYHTHTPAHFLFNNQVLDMDRKYAILVEGQFDALAISGVSSQGAKLSPEQASWLKQSGKQIIVLPDREIGTNSQKMIDLALAHDWMVSFPKWDNGIKDANDAVNKYGQLYTVGSIIQQATDNKLKINLMRKKLGK